MGVFMWVFMRVCTGVWGCGCISKAMCLLCMWVHVSWHSIVVDELLANHGVPSLILVLCVVPQQTNQPTNNPR